MDLGDGIGIKNGMKPPFFKFSQKMEGSIYLLQFKNEGEMEDILIFTDRVAAFERLKLAWNTRNLLEYNFNDGIGFGIKCIYYSDEKGALTEYKCSR